MGAGFHGGFGGTHGDSEKHKGYIENTLLKTSPIKIPSSADVKEEQKNGYGKNTRPAKHEILVGKNKWVSKKEWQAAIRARKNGTATNEQKEMLDNGHWKPKK